MADLVITPADVIRNSAARQPVLGVLAEAVAAGQSLARNDAGQYVLADSNHATPALRRPKGIALAGGSAGQTIPIHREGRIDIGAAVAVGTVYVQSATSGGIAPVADLASGNEVTIIGVGVSVSEIDVFIIESGAVVP